MNYADGDSYERSDDMRLILQTLDKIDQRTDAMDERLRHVEQKINNGLSHSVATTERLVNEMKSEQDRIKEETAELRRLEEQRKRRMKWLAGIASGLLVAAGSVGLRLLLGG